VGERRRRLCQRRFRGARFRTPEAAGAHGRPLVDRRGTGRRRNGNVGQRYVFACPAPGPGKQGNTDFLYGTRIYSDDSAVCLAAVHAGIISPIDGGRVTVQIAGPQQSFAGSTGGFGFVSGDYGAWNGSYFFVR
jgi:hypothetical protein